MQIVQQASPFRVRIEKCARKALQAAAMIVHQDKLIRPICVREPGGPQRAAILEQRTVQEVVAQDSAVSGLPAMRMQLRDGARICRSGAANRH